MADNGGPVILVVGKDPFKASVVKVLEEFGYNVQNTTEISVPESAEELNISRRWISKNSLRRLDGKEVRIIFALDAKGGYDDEWVNVLRLIFKKDYGHAVAVILEDDNLRSPPLDELFHNKVVESVTTVHGDSLREPGLKQIVDEMKLSSIKAEPVSMSRNVTVKRTTPWSREKVILFGRTGSGKSTVAQMLTSGRLDHNSKFKSCSDARGVTKDIVREQGRGWHVTDTPGFGEPKERGSTVSTKEASAILQKFVESTGGIYSHYVYVYKKGRMDVYDEKLWKFFNTIFADAEENFSVVVTNCEEELTEADKAHLKKTFEGCKNFIYVDFPKLVKDNPELELENEDIRRDSLKDLEDGLASLEVAEKDCELGAFSAESVNHIRSGMRATIVGNCSKQGGLGNVIVGALHHLVVKPIAAVGWKLNRTKVDESFVLLPY